MRGLRGLSLATAALIAAAALTTGLASAASATIVGIGTGTGATEAAATAAARTALISDYFGCKLPYFMSDGQNADGTWWATATANCGGLR
jgi:hypothetical protein